MPIRVDEKLNFTIPIERASDGRRIYVHAMPVSREVFDTYFLVIGQTFTMINGGRLGVVAGPRLAWRLLRKAAMDLGEWEGPEGVEQGFLGEVVRMASVVAPVAENGGGWETIPLDQALNQGIIGEEDKDVVLNALVFFTVSSLMLPKRMNGASFRREYLDGALRLWAAQTSPLNVTDYIASLKTLTADESTGATRGTA